MTAPKKQRVPKGRVMWCEPDGLCKVWAFEVMKERDFAATIPVAVIPCPTAKAAREIVRLHAMSEEELENSVINALSRAYQVRYRREWREWRLPYARAVLSALGLKGR